jgi:glyoxylase I family protein
MTNLSAFHHIGLACADPEVVEAFYCRHFGFERARVIPLTDGQIVFLRSSSAYLELFKAAGQAPSNVGDGAGPTTPGWRHLAFKVDDVEAKLAEMGQDARVTLGPLGFDDIIRGWSTVWVADPEGNVVEISQGYVDQ